MMKVEKLNFTIATKSQPLLFADYENNDTANIDEAILYDDEQIALDDIERLDFCEILCDKELQVLPLKITYEY